MTVTELHGDLLASPHPYLLHQLNCTTRGARGLASAIFSRWPAADAYARRAGAVSQPGTFDVTRLPDARAIVGLFAQRHPGKSRPPSDSAAARLAWFAAALDAFAEAELHDPALREVAVPARIGCGLAGGDWGAYRAALEQWAERWDVHVHIYENGS